MSDIRAIAEKFSNTWWDESDLIDRDSNEIRSLATDWLKLTASLEEFRMWLAGEIGKRGGIGAITDDPPTTCLVIARSFIETLTALLGGEFAEIEVRLIAHGGRHSPVLMAPWDLDALLQEVRRLLAARGADRQEMAMLRGDPAAVHMGALAALSAIKQMGDLKMHLNDREYRLAGTEASLAHAEGEVEALKTRVAQQDAAIAGLWDAITSCIQAMESAWYELEPGPREMGDQFIRQHDMQARIELARAALAAVPPAPDSVVKDSLTTGCQWCARGLTSVPLDDVRSFHVTVLSDYANSTFAPCLVSRNGFIPECRCARADCGECWNRNALVRAESAAVPPAPANEVAKETL